MFLQLISSLFQNTGLVPVVAKTGAQCMTELELLRTGVPLVFESIHQTKGGERY